MKYSYYPGCTLKNKAEDLDAYARASAKVLGFNWKNWKNGSAAAACTLWGTMRSPQNLPLSGLCMRPGKKGRNWSLCVPPVTMC